ncbi:MAG: hypothetical protein KDC35_10795 [Acidobacteria bacterium]|nr:hypothetical protein [Acidobacteriota bacterium]
MNLQELALLLGEGQSFPQFNDPFEFVLWTQVGYLVSHEKRMAAFERLKADVGLRVGDILGADLDRLCRITRLGGSIGAELRASRMKASAEWVVNTWQGDLTRVFALPVEQAVRTLMKIPMIGRPGAETLLMVMGAQPLLGLESNGLRVLLRLGFGEDKGKYDKTYSSVQQAVRDSLPHRTQELVALHLRLKRHGETVCRNKKPMCNTCKLQQNCTFASA